MTLRMLGLYIDDNSISIMNLATGDGKQLTEINLFCLFVFVLTQNVVIHYYYPFE